MHGHRVADLGTADRGIQRASGAGRCNFNRILVGHRGDFQVGFMGTMTIPLEVLRLLCAQHWNPIGIPLANMTIEKETPFRPMPEDEYDRYLLYVEYLFANKASEKEILAYLDTVEREYLMLSSPRGNKRKFIASIQDWIARTN